MTLNRTQLVNQRAQVAWCLSAQCGLSLAEIAKILRCRGKGEARDLVARAERLDRVKALREVEAAERRLNREIVESLNR